MVVEPRPFWEKWKNFNETETTAKRPNIEGEEWYGHFSNLHCEKGEPSTQQPECDVINQGNISNEPFSEKAF